MPPLPGAGPTPGGPTPPKPALPGNMAGGPTGPGGSPAMSPGDGAGNQAGAAAMVQAVIPALIKAMLAYPPGSKEFQALNRAISSLNPLFAKQQTESMVPAAIQQLAAAGKTGGPRQ